MNCNKSVFVDVLEDCVRELRSYVDTLKNGGWPLEPDALPETVRKLQWLLEKMRICYDEEAQLMLAGREVRDDPVPW